MYLVFTEKSKFSFLFYTTLRGHFPIHKAGDENAKNKTFLKTQLILVPHYSLRSN